MISATVDTAKTPIELTITSDKRKVSVLVSAVGEEVTATGTFPVKITDATRTWTKKTDDGAVAVYTS